MGNSKKDLRRIQSESMRGQLRRKEGAEGSGNPEDDVLVDVHEITENAQSFVEKYGNILFWVLAIPLIFFLGYYAYKTFVLKPKQKAAIEAISQAQYQFERDSFNLALTNPGNGAEGFLDIIEGYGGTTTGNLAKYYAGVSYLNLGDYEQALEYLKKYKAHDLETTITKFGAMGDAASSLGNDEEAIGYYKKAVAQDNNVLTPIYLLRLGLLQEKMGNSDAALNSFEKIQTQYPESEEGKTIEKYITRVAG